MNALPSPKPNRRMRLALRFAVLVVAVSVLGASGRCVSRQATISIPQDRQIIPVYDLEDIHRSTLPNHNEELRIVVNGYRTGKSLRVRIEVYNLSDEAKLVPPVTPAAYNLEFRDSKGYGFRPFWARRNFRHLHKSKFASVSPGNALAGVFELPTFYEHFADREPIQIHVWADFEYEVKDEAPYKMARFALSSKWIQVPRSRAARK